MQDGDGEDRNHEGKGGRGGVGQRGEEADDGAGKSRAYEGGEAERPDTGTGAGGGHTSPPAACLSLQRCHACLSCAMALSFTVGHTCPVS